jgi:two-component system sensor histidine kinase ResE
MDGALQTEEQRSRVAGIINAEAERLSRLIQGLLDLARIQAGRFSINQRDLDVNALLERCCERLTPQAQAVGVTLDVHHPRRSLPIRGDAERLDQVLANLVDSVLARTRDGGRVQVHASLGGVRGLPAAARGNGHDEGANGKLGRWWVEIVVKENGTAPDGQSMVFTPEPKSTRERGEDGANLGLGLVIAREIVAAHGGDLLVQCAPEAGTAFTVRLPMNVSN